MDRLTLISGTLFIAADVFAIVSLAMPDWIVTDVGGKPQLAMAFDIISELTKQIYFSTILI